MSKVVFPAPPPTTNSLTSEQRIQLLRRTKKLGQILGSTPHLLDASVVSVLGPMHIELPYKESRVPRLSTDSLSSSSCSTSDDDLPSSLERKASLSSSSHSIRSIATRASSITSRSSSSESVDSFDSWTGRKPPFLRLAKASPLESIPASPLSYSADSAPSSRSHSRQSSLDDSYTLSIGAASSPRDSITMPTFNIPSTNSVRLQKMERLRRKLGDGVPLDLVFPEEKSAKEPTVSSVRYKNEDWEILSPPAPNPRTKRQPRIAQSRDSIVGPSPHRARRNKPQPPLPTTETSPPPSPALPSCVSSSHVRRPSASSGRSEKLTVIIESPDEHGSGCSAEFGIVHAVSGYDSTWYSSDDSDAPATQVYNTRRGYEGWSQPKSPLSKVDGAARKSWSYRKPPPSIEC